MQSAATQPGRAGSSPALSSLENLMNLVRQVLPVPGSYLDSRIDRNRIQLEAVMAATLWNAVVRDW